MSHQNLRLSFSLALALFFSMPLLATNYYVASPALYPGASDANAGTSLASPFATLAKAIGKATVAGDTIFVRSGTYVVTTTIKITKSGIAAKHIVLTAYKPDLVNANSRPVFDFSGMSVTSGNIGLSMSGASYWDIFGIVIKGAGDNGMLMQSSCHHVKVEFCSFTRNRDSGLQIRSGSHHCLILNCDSYENADLGAGTTTLGGNADGYAPKLDVGDSVIFRGCRAWMNSDDGWDGYLKSTSTYPDGITTIVEDCWAFHNGYYWLDGSTTAEQNGNGFKMGGSGAKDEAHNFVVTRCLAFNNKSKGYDQNNNAGSMYLYNNTANNNGSYDFGLNSSGVTYAAGSVLEMVNNISLGSKGTTIRTGTSVTKTTNSFVTGTTSDDFVSLDSTGVTAMRSLDGNLPAITYMHLKTSTPSSAYIDAGTALPLVKYHDAVGLPYNGAALDLGAFETTPAATVSYRFTGNGNWNNAANWLNSSVPPATIVPAAQIIIDPVAGGECILNIPYTVSAGASLTVMEGKNFRVPGTLTVTK